MFYIKNIFMATNLSVRVLLVIVININFLVDVSGQLLTGMRSLNVHNPDNIDCDRAIQFCDDFMFSYSYTNEYANDVFYEGGQYYDWCFWFKFKIDYEQDVRIRVHVTRANSVHLMKYWIVHLLKEEEDIENCMEYDRVCEFIPDDQDLAQEWASKIFLGSPPETFDSWYDQFDIQETLLPGIYYIRFPPDGRPAYRSYFVEVVEGDLKCCSDCLPSFLPEAGKRYVVNAWTRKLSGTGADGRVRVEAPAGQEVGLFSPDLDRPPVEGWRLIEGVFEMPDGVEEFELFLESTDGEVLFDDVRVFPADGSMKSYVYDPENLRFVAELDERHYATLYEYDQEGNLVRVKKETERGIMTIQENRRHGVHVSTAP